MTAASDLLSAFAERARTGAVTDDIDLRVPVSSGNTLDLRVLGVARGGTRGQPLAVAFHGSIDRGRRRIPAFEGRFISRIGRGRVTVVGFADPSLALAPGFRVSWFAKTESRDVPTEVAEVLRELVAAFQPSRLVFYGSSAGGHPALIQSLAFPDSICVVKNAIAHVGAYFPDEIANFRRVCWPSLGPDTPLRDVMQDDVGDLYAAGFPHTVVFLQNATDHHLYRQCIPFLARVPADSPRMLPIVTASSDAIGHVYPTDEIGRWVVASALAASARPVDILAAAERIADLAAPAPRISPDRIVADLLASVGSHRPETQ